MTLLKRILQFVAGVVVLLLLLVGVLVLFVPGIHISTLGMVLNVMTGAGADTPDEELLSRLRAAEGYSLSVYARGIGNPRMLHHAGKGRLLVSSPRSGEVLQISDTDGDGAADEFSVLLSELRRPHGIDVHGSYLYVAESNRVGRIAYEAEAGAVSGEYSVVVDGFTDNGNHWSKSLRLDEAGRLYVAMGSTCNVCEESDPRRATIMRFDPETGSGEVYAGGLRNSVGLDFAPWDGALYATDNGRDLLGDHYPPCELNRIEEGAFYGWPYLNADNDLDPDFGAGREDLQASSKTPVFNFPAHNAPLGIHFPAVPSADKVALVALHGSWNRSLPDGYKVLKLRWQDDGRIQAEDFLWGFEQNEDIIGRPVDITSDGRGNFFVSDDYARVVYRLSREGGAAAALDMASEPQTIDRQALDPALATAGEQLYRDLPCADCHESEALTPVYLLDLGQSYSAESLAAYFLTPTPPMPRYELSEDQRAQLAHYLLSREQNLAEQ